MKTEGLAELWSHSEAIPPTTKGGKSLHWAPASGLIDVGSEQSFAKTQKETEGFETWKASLCLA